MSDSLPLRRAGAADAAAVRGLSRAAYAKWAAQIGREPKPMTADYEAAVRDHIIDLFEVDGALVALIEMIPAPTHLLIENIAVDPLLQGQGIGDRLLRHAERVALARDLPEIQLYTNVSFASNIAFYAKRSFTEFRRETFPGGSIAVHMRKFIA